MVDLDSTEQSRLEQLLGRAWNALPLAAVIVDQEGTIRYCSDQTSYLLGYEPGALVGRQVETIMARTHEVRDAPPKPDGGDGSGGASGDELEFFARHQDGSAVPIRLSLTQVDHGDDSDEVWTLVLMQDRRPYGRGEAGDSEEEERYRQLFNQEQVGLIWASLNGDVLSCNPAAAKIFGYESPEDFEGESFARHYRGDMSDRRRTLEQLRKRGEVSKWNVPMKRRDGRPITILETLVLHEESTYDDPVVVSNFVEVTEQARLWKELKEMAYHDPLTGLPNRRFLKGQARKVFALADRRDRYAGVAYLDLDEFKRVNDRWGHDMGDEVLVAIAERAERTIRESDVVARIGGDEFAVLWADLDASDEALVATRRIMDSFEQPFHVGEKTFTITLSAGVATFPDDGEDIAELLERADEAMYRAKEAGNSVATYSAGGDDG